MSAFKGTPGPWIHERTVAPRGWNIEARDGTYTVAVARDGSGSQENEANARLIAAAPDLLSCLDMTAHGLEVASRVVGGELGAVFSDRAMSARDAIAKATGGAA